MLYFAGLVGLLLILSAEARIGNSSESSFCTETKECLLYDLVCKSDHYEVRHYSAFKVVSTNETSLNVDVARLSAFMRLFQYISGTNADGVKIDMTAPVLLKVKEHRKLLHPSVYTMSFVLPLEHQTNPPEPTDAKVFLHDMPDLKVYVSSYGGWATPVMTWLKCEALTKELNKVEASYNKEFHYQVGYNSPMKILNRHNEVWYVADGEPMCPTPCTAIPSKRPPQNAGPI